MMKLTMMMNLLMSCVTIIVVLSNPSNCSKDGNWELVQVQFIAVSGDREPKATFPGDIHLDHWNEKDFGTLTPLGALQHRDLGIFLRDKYRDFLPLHYDEDRVHILSAQNGNALQSAHHCMSSLFSLKKYVPSHLMHRVPSSVKAQTELGIVVPVAIVDQITWEDNHILRTSTYCPVLDRQRNSFLNSPEFQQMSAHFHELGEHLIQASGHPDNETETEEERIEAIWDVCDALLVWTIHELSYPDWVNDTVVHQCRQFMNFMSSVEYRSETARRLRGGPLVEHILRRFQWRVEEDSSYILRGYFTQPSTMSAFLSRFGMHNHVQPPFASAVLIELYRNRAPSNDDKDSQYGIRFLYRNDTQSPDLTLPALMPQHCSELKSDQVTGLCSFAALSREMEPLVGADFWGECDAEDEQSKLKETIWWTIRMAFMAIIVVGIMNRLIIIDNLTP